MNIDNDYDSDGNNIVPCPICLDIYCPSKEGGKRPVSTREFDWKTKLSIQRNEPGFSIEDFIHQELQKAREESVKALEVTDSDIPPFPSAKDSESARIGFITGVAWARTKTRNEVRLYVWEKNISFYQSKIDEAKKSIEYNEKCIEEAKEKMQGIKDAFSSARPT